MPMRSCGSPTSNRTQQNGSRTTHAAGQTVSITPSTSRQDGSRLMSIRDFFVGLMYKKTDVVV
jgi:hypothetical protein